MVKSGVFSHFFGVNLFNSTKLVVHLAIIPVFRLTFIFRAYKIGVISDNPSMREKIYINRASRKRENNI